MDSFIWDRQRQKKQLLTQSTQKQTVKTIQGRVTWSREAFISLSLLHFICALLTSWSKQKWISKNSNLCENDKLTHVVIFIITGTDLWMMSKWGCVCVGRGGVTGDATSTCYVCVCVCVCVCGHYQRLNCVRTPPDCVRVCLICLGWSGLGLWWWWYVGHSHYASLAPLDRAGSTGEGGEDEGRGAERAVGLRTVKEKWRIEKSNENEMCLIFWWRRVGGGVKGFCVQRGAGPSWMCDDSNTLTDLLSDTWGFGKKLEKTWINYKSCDLFNR